MPLSLCPTKAIFEVFLDSGTFADDNSVDAEWLDTLETGAKNPATRYVVPF